MYHTLRESNQFAHPKPTHKPVRDFFATLEWLIDQYRGKVGNRSGIVNEPHRADDPRQIVRLIGTKDKYTVSLGLALFRGEYNAEFGGLMAASTVMMLPVVILFFLTQRTFIQGITLTGIKG